MNFRSESNQPPDKDIPIWIDWSNKLSVVGMRDSCVPLSHTWRCWCVHVLMPCYQATYQAPKRPHTIAYFHRHGDLWRAFLLPHHSTFAQSSVHLASLLFSLQRASGDKEWRKSQYWCNNSSYCWKIQKFFFLRHEVREAMFINSEAILRFDRKVFQGPFKGAPIILGALEELRLCTVIMEQKKRGQYFRVSTPLKPQNCSDG